MKKIILLAGACLASISTAHADAPASDDSLTYKGVTVYGLVDVNATYQTHGENTNSAYPVGLDYLIIGAKNAAGSKFNLSDNGISGSKIGIKGTEALGGGWNAVFKLESEFNPLSGQLMDGLKAMVQQNGIPLAQQTTAWGDSNKAGQLLNANEYIGFSNAKFGQITVGRQSAIFWDDLIKYDPNRGALNLSLLGYSGQPAGGGDTEDRYVNNTLKYWGDFGALHGGAMYGFGDGTAEGKSIELDLGAHVAAFSVDALYKHTKDAVSASPLTTNTTGALSAAQTAAMTAFGFNEGNTLAASITDNTAVIINAKVDVGHASILGGYEHILFKNPTSPVSSMALVDGLGAGTTIGGYNILTNNSSLPAEKTVQIAWLGARYAASKKWDLSASYYFEAQNNYSTSAALAGCTSATVSGQCSGHFYGAGLMSEYRVNHHLEVYSGAMWSKVAGGMANGYLNGSVAGNQSASTIDPTVGLRLSF